MMRSILFGWLFAGAVLSTKWCDKKVAVYSSSKNGKRFNRTDVYFKSTRSKPVDHEITINLNKNFGAAFTDSAGINLLSLSEDLRETLIAQYWGPNGIELTTGRVPIASTDFSTHAYSYLDTENDFNLTTFALAPEDFQLKIPFIKMAQRLRGGALTLFATPWSAPGWMKETGKMVSGGKLKGEFGGQYYETWTRYYLRFFEEYAKNGVEFWGLAVQNEPSLGQVQSAAFISFHNVQNRRELLLYYSPADEREFIKQHLGPAIRNHPLTKNLKLMCNDDQRFELPTRPDTANPERLDCRLLYVDGVSVWVVTLSSYEDFIFSSKSLNEVHDHHPTKFILATEACNGYSFLDHGPNLGSWEGGEAYGTSIIDDLNHWVAGWTDWNLCLDMTGGPTFVNNSVDSSIIVNAQKNEFYKQPTFYVLGHFSKFIRPSSVRVDMQISNLAEGDLTDGVAFKTPDNQLVVVLQNASGERAFNTTDRPLNSITVTLEPNSIYTFVWNL
ncbi:Glucosylceramidase [Aphelenchoides fujianensis]|nr:Glucosylceramidase [Aphelenchoides fujianensis]